MDITLKKNRTKYRIQSNGYCLFIDKITKKSSSRIGYFHSMDEIFRRLIKYELMTFEDVADIKSTITDVCRQLSESVSEIVEKEYQSSLSTKQNKAKKSLHTSKS